VRIRLKGCGIIIELGSGVKSLNVNDRVWAYLPLESNSQGFMAEYVIVKEKFVGLKPKNLSFESAAILPYAFIIFWEEFVEKNQFSLGDCKNKRFANFLLDSLLTFFIKI